jgi:hypothetical protein
MFQNAGEKSTGHFDLDDPPRSRANKRRGSFANDWPPILGTLERVSGQVRLHVVMDTKQTTLRAHVEQFTRPGTQLYTDEYESYATIDRPHTDDLLHGTGMGAWCGWGWLMRSAYQHL